MSKGIWKREVIEDKEPSIKDIYEIIRNKRILLKHPFIHKLLQRESKKEISKDKKYLVGQNGILPY